MKYAIYISYLGKNYSGWQLQPDAKNIQAEIEAALFKISRENIRVIGAGRTDRGVNALAQVASFDISREWQPEKLLLALNFHLPLDIRIMKVSRVSENFNARYSAKLREYKYFIYEGISCPPFLSDIVWWRKCSSDHKWDISLAKQACKLIEGKHDFRAFCKTEECPEDSVRTIQRAKLRRICNGKIIILSVKAQSFMTNMIRIIVGNINAVATGKKNLEWLENLLTGKSRSESAMTAPASGLCFWGADYDEKFFTQIT